MHRFFQSLLVLAVVLAGCEPAIDTYRYFRVTSPQFTIDETGHSRIGEMVIAHVFHDEIPIQYSYREGSYAIQANVALDSLKPELRLKAMSIDGKPLLLGGRVVDNCFGVILSDDYRDTGLNEPWPVLRYFWSKRVLPECEGRVTPYGEPLDIQLRITTTDGRRLADHTVSVSLESSGTYFYWIGP